MDYMDRELHEECGVFGIIGHQDASQICYYGLHSLQHRGQEAAGICCENNGKMIFHKGEGLVTEVFNQDKLKELQGNSAIGHVRYSTAGGGGIANVQPFVFRTMQGSMSICHNGNLVNANILKQELEEQNISSSSITFPYPNINPSSIFIHTKSTRNNTKSQIHLGSFEVHRVTVPNP